MLIKYEFLKILRRKSTLIIMAVSLLLTMFLFGLPIMQYQTNNQEGTIKGLEGISYEKEQYTDLSVPLTNEYISETILKYQQLFKNPDNVGNDGNETFLIGNAYWDFVAPRTKLLNTIAGNYDNPGEYSGYNKLLDLNVDNGTDFYQTRENKIKALLNNPSREQSDEQKKYWQSMSNKIEIPMQYGYYEGWEIIISSFELLMFALLSICITLAPVFSGEYQAGTDAVILSGKYGKTKLNTAKIISSLLFGVLAFTLHVVVAFGISLFAFGVDGWNLPLQIANTSIMYPFTFMQATFINLIIIYLILLAMIGLTLLLSAKMKSPYLVLIVLIPILFIPLFLTPTGTTGLYNLTLFLLPYRATMPEVGKFISYQFGGLVLNVLSMRAIVYVIIMVVTLPLARLEFKKHQVIA